MRAHKLLSASAAMALLGTSALAQDSGFFGGLNLRGSTQLASREDNLKPNYMGFGLELGYKFAWGNLSAEVGFLYKPGDQYLLDINEMEWDLYKPNVDKSADSRKNEINGLNIRLAYEKPFERFSLKGGVMIANFKYRQEYMGHVEDSSWKEGWHWEWVGEGMGYDGWDWVWYWGELDGWIDAYNGVLEKNKVSVNPFIGVTFPITPHHKVEINVVGINYTSINYHHVAGTVWGFGANQTTKDYVTTKNRFMPHLEFSYGFRF